MKLFITLTRFNHIRPLLNKLINNKELFLMYFKKLITIITSSFAVFAIAVCLISCGHSITHTDRGTGLVIRIPLPDGSSLIDLKIGKIDSTTTVLRGGTSYDSIASTGGSINGAMGTSDRIQISTIPQLNEGYTAEVLQSKYTSEGVKKLLINSYMSKAKPNDPLPSKSISIGSAVASGSGAFSVEPERIAVVGSEIIEVAPNDRIIGIGGRIVLFSSVIVILFIITSVVIVSIISRSSNKLANKKNLMVSKEEKLKKFNKKFENY